MNKILLIILQVFLGGIGILIGGFFIWSGFDLFSLSPLAALIEWILTPLVVGLTILTILVLQTLK